MQTHPASPTPWTTHSALLADFPPRSFGSRGAWSDKPAIVDGDLEISWADLRRRVDAAIGVLVDMGVGYGDHVGLLLDNRPEYFEIAFAAMATGAAIVPLNHRLAPAQLTEQLRVADCSVLLAEPGLLELVDEVWERPSHATALPICDGEGGDDFVARRKARAPERSITAFDENASFFLAMTGGTTGVPKACVVTSRVQVQWWRLTALEFDMRPTDTHLVMGPLHHGLAFFFAFAQLGIGGTISLLRHFDAEGVVAATAVRDADTTVGVPTMYRRLLQAGWTASGIRNLIVGGAALPPALRHSMEEQWLDAGIYDYYGASDGGIFAIRKPEYDFLSDQSAGYPPAGIELAILDRSGDPLPPGETGTIYKRGLGLGAVYYRRPKATRELYIGDWHTVGDQGHIDEHGALVVEGRENDTIITGGVNVFPAMVEAVLEDHPSVSEAVVVGVPDPEWGESVQAVLVGPDIDLEDVSAYCRTHLSNYERPKRLLVWEDLPRSGAHKVSRQQIADIVRGEQAGAT